MKRIIPIILIIILSFVFSINVFAYSFTYNNVTYYDKVYTLTYNTDNTSFINISSYGLKAYLASSVSTEKFVLDCNYIKVTHSTSGTRGIYITFSSNGSTNATNSNEILIEFVTPSGVSITPSNVYAVIITRSKSGSSSYGLTFNNGGTTSHPNTSLVDTLNQYGLYFNRDFTYSNSNFGFSLSNTGYSINFNSNSGTTIEPITDIEPGSTVNLDVSVGGITTYNPAYIPEREGFIFEYWYELDYPLTPVHSIIVNEDITLIAKWSNDASLAYITFGDGFYSDINHTNVMTGGFYEIGSFIDFYTYYSGSQIYRGKVAFTDLNDDVTYYLGPSGSYRYHVQITESGLFSLVLLDYCTTYVSLYPDVEGTYVSHIQYAIQDGEWHNYTFDDALTIQPGYQLHFRFYLTAPYVITEGVYYYSLTDYENVFIRSDVKTNNDWQTFWTEVYLDFTVNHSGTLYLYVKSISDFDITSRDIVGVYDESTGEFSWAVSEVSLLDTNWEDVASNVPQNLAYMFDGIYSLSGLAIIVPLCMMVAFGLWFIRRS